MSPVLLLALVAAVPAAWAQVQMAQPAAQEEIAVYIDESGDARAVHVLRPSSQMQQLEPIAGAVSDVAVRGEDGGELQHAMASGGAILVFPSDAAVSVEYVLAGAVERNGTLWRWEFLYPRTVLFVLPPGLETVYANDRPVHLDGGDRFRCHGCQLRLEYPEREPVTHHEVRWEEHRFVVAVRGHGATGDIRFDQPSMSLSFGVEGGQFATVAVPLELLGGPYQVLVGDEKVWFHKYRDNATHTWINFRPDSGGTATIVGATVIPEFPEAAAMMAAAIVPLLALTRYWSRTSKSRTRPPGTRTGDTLWYR